MERKWWHGKTAYQIYPKSFLDSNGDGNGDLPGIISKLDYLQDLGIGLLWLSPIYRSPLADQGYDISDYYSIDPRFGTMADMDCLLAEARRRDIGVVMDLVVNHCSDEHPWFREACRDPEGPYGQFFYIRDRQEGLPCNWRSYFGGPCWEPLPGHPDKLYFHAFHRKQPDLNWENPALRREIYKMINWWLDKGLAGFRIDAIINIKKLLPFRDFPADRPDGLCAMQHMLREARGVGDFLEEMAEETFRKYDAFTVGEVFDEKPEELPRFIGDRGYFSTMFDFAETVLGESGKGWYNHAPVTPEQYKAACFQSQAKTAGVGFLSNLIENHDEPRGVSRYLPETTEAGKKMLGGLNFFLQGLPFLYQGQEIGMENTVFRDIADIDDISTQAEYRTALEAGFSPAEALAAVGRFSRDNARTPFQWSGGPGAGFTSGTPWLAVNPNYTWLNLEAQQADPDSVYHFYKRLIALRSSPAYRETLVYGKTEPYLPERENLMAYFRRGDRVLLIAGNFQAAPQVMPLPGPVQAVLINNLGTLEETPEGLALEGYQFVALELADAKG